MRTLSTAGWKKALRASSSARRPCAIPSFVREAARLHPGRIAVGVDAKNGFVAVDGWARATRMSALDLGKSFEDAGVERHHLHRHLARRRFEGPEYRGDPGARRRLDDSRHRLGRPRVARRRGAAAAARLPQARRRHHRPRALRRAARSGAGAGADPRACGRPRTRDAESARHSLPGRERTAASSRASISSICATPAIRSNAPSPMTPPAPTNSAFSTSPQATRTAAFCSTSCSARRKPASCR